MTPTGHWRFSILRVYWDGETTPSIEVPVGDFFASGWGKYGQISSLAVAVNPGSAFNCYWAMPFRKSCRITMTNIAAEGDDALLPDRLHAHRDPRRRGVLPRAVPPREPAAVQAGLHDRRRREGRGPLRRHAPVAGACNNTGWWGEGEIKFFMDGDTEFPTICGTGTEDYFCGSYNFENQDDATLPGVHDAVLGAAAGACGPTASTSRSSASASTAGTSWIPSASSRICA